LALSISCFVTYSFGISISLY